jgi:hypothetical protein
VYEAAEQALRADLVRTSVADVLRGCLEARWPSIVDLATRDEPAAIEVTESVTSMLTFRKE